ncbi:Nucleotidyltransferase [Cantharellus anzutake]|uniref:Nucleotidyltransferase n=1 Tax=Cantharellus anzutake TaxID=1750568 RepID=UPI001908DF04|nr:Nucleotidyltransferase [Cantharellus anzutake]KAF8326570.1 Nucleotidyltransferase [Cantharellus anzutake]
MQQGIGGKRCRQHEATIASIRRHPTRLKSGKEALKLRFVGQRMAEKIDDVIKTGNMRRLQYEESTESAIVTKLFMGIYGVGMTTARDWYSRGMRTLDDLSGSHRRIVLTPAQQIGLKYYTDLAERMPRSEAKAIFDAIKAIAIGIDPSLELTIMGSYRRGQETCGDIDILLTRPTIDGRSHSGVLRKLLPKLRAAGVLTEDLSYPSDLDDEEAKYMGLCRLGHEGKMRRIDILTIPYHQRGAALIYFTGDDVFNRSLRLKARHDGYSLNQRGLFTGVTRDPKTKVKLSNGIIIASETEREIFNILKVPWQEPHQRRRAT